MSVKFFNSTIGKALSPDNPENWYKAYPHKASKGVTEMRIGNSGAFYAANANGNGLLISNLVNMPESGIKFIMPSPTVSARKETALWLINHAVAPFIVGEIGKANPIPSFDVSKHELKAVFCQSAGNFKFNLAAVRKAYEEFKPFPWKKIAALLWAWQSFSLIQSEANEAKLKKALSAIPGADEVVQNNPIIKPDSGEFKILQWANIEK